MGKSTLSMAIFNSYVSHYQRVLDLYLCKQGHIYYGGVQSMTPDCHPVVDLAIPLTFLNPSKITNNIPICLMKSSRIYKSSKVTISVGETCSKPPLNHHITTTKPSLNHHKTPINHHEINT